MSLNPQQAALVAVQISLDRDQGVHLDPDVIVQLDEPVVEDAMPYPIPGQRRRRSRHEENV